MILCLFIPFLYISLVVSFGKYNYKLYLIRKFQYPSFFFYFVTEAIDATEILWGLYEYSSMSCGLFQGIEMLN